MCGLKRAARGCWIIVHILCHFHAMCTLLVPRYVLVSRPIGWHNSEDFFFLLCCLSKKSLHPLPPESHPAAARSMKLLAKIPKDAEAVIVLVGKLLEKVVHRIIFLCVLLFSNLLMRHFSFIFKYQGALSCRCFTIHGKHDTKSACNNAAFMW